ncbi:hypothetical protein D7V86_00580 [bacterium D16-51]|nr:hypothetical protein D7V96_24930 [bacterium D16-59]RKI62732.1 hypothetical protein D7V86_00580 [bacterium D16-51]
MVTEPTKILLHFAEHGFDFESMAISYDGMYYSFNFYALRFFVDAEKTLSSFCSGGFSYQFCINIVCTDMLYGCTVNEFYGYKNGNYPG